MNFLLQHFENGLYFIFLSQLYIIHYTIIHASQFPPLNTKHNNTESKQTTSGFAIWLKIVVLRVSSSA